MPIIDYHCHLPPQEIANDKTWETITELWLGGDHYKWRAMRSNGINENLVTGSADSWEKFSGWAETMPKLMGNPLYHWNQLELARYFDIYELLSTNSSQKIYTQCNELLGDSGLSARKLIEKSNVKVICTTDDPCDTLNFHHSIEQDESISCKVIPAWRPDKAMMPELGDNFVKWIELLSNVSDTNIASFDNFIDALEKRHQFFHDRGCRLSDHGVETFYAEEYTERDIQNVFKKVMSGSDLVQDEVLKFKSHMLYIFGVMDAEKNWVQQYHYGALRNNSSRLFKQLGPDIGCDSIGDWSVAEPMSKLFSRLDEEGKLAKTIIYPINPRDNEMVGAMIGNFQDGSVPGKIQFGSGWW
ncbi:MAG: glucuronate isomerase, partial [Verrucomicrobia bacterium]